MHMPDARSALTLVLSADPVPVSIIALSLVVSFSAVLFAATIGVPLGAVLALVRFPGRNAVVVLLNAMMGLPPVVVGLAIYLLFVALGPPRRLWTPVHPAGDGHCPDRAGGADHCGAGAPDHRGPVA